MRTAVADGPTLQPVRDHYVARWGEPAETFHPVRTRNQSGFPGQVLWWPPARTGLSEVELYATVGASMLISDGGHASELFCRVSSPCSGVADGLADACTRLLSDGIAISHGTTFTFGKSLWRGTRMNAFLFLRQKTTLEPLAGPGWHVEFHQAVPVFDYEVAIKRAEGVAGLQDWWTANRILFWDVHRKAVSSAK